jgi:hypothetical protein
MTWLIVAVLVAAVPALLAFWLSVACVRRRRPVAAACAGLVSLTCIVGCVAVGLIAANLLTWSRFTHESPAAELAFASEAPRTFVVDVTYADGRRDRFTLAGDEWQIDARVIKWRPFATLLGFDTVFRLERLSGRYRDIDSEMLAPRSVHRLHPTDSFDLWMLVRAAHLPWVDAQYGSAVYLPMADGATFAVSVGTGGLVARPTNDAARAAVGGWH